jgi:excisionase family DNA binding protein
VHQNKVELAQISRVTLYRFINEGELQGYKIGGKWLFKKRDVQSLVREVPAPSKN